jgi:hypothetical protein
LTLRIVGLSRPRIWFGVTWKTDQLAVKFENHNLNSNPRLIDKTQTAFMKNRFIMDGVVVLHEILHEVKKKKNVRCSFQSEL